VIDRIARRMTVPPLDTIANASCMGDVLDHFRISVAQPVVVGLSSVNADEFESLTAEGRLLCENVAILLGTHRRAAQVYALLRLVEAMTRQFERDLSPEMLELFNKEATGIEQSVRRRMTQ